MAERRVSASFIQAFDEPLAECPQRVAFHRYLEGLLWSTEHNKTLTGVANTAPVVDVHYPVAQRLQLWEGHAIALYIR
jgi:hypothetical protein